MGAMTPRLLHKLAAGLEMFTWAFLIFSMILKYSGTTAALTPIAGGIHGFGFLTFLVVNTLLWANGRWPFSVGLLAWAVTVIPLAAWPFTVWLERRGLLDDAWRFQDAEEKPHGIAEQVLA